MNEQEISYLRRRIEDDINEIEGLYIVELEKLEDENIELKDQIEDLKKALEEVVEQLKDYVEAAR